MKQLEIGKHSAASMGNFEAVNLATSKKHAYNLRIFQVTQKPNAISFKITVTLAIQHCIRLLPCKGWTEIFLINCIVTGK